MRDRLAEKFPDVVVMEPVDYPVAIAVTRNESQVPQQPKLVRDGRRLHLQSVRKLANRQWRLMETRQDAKATHGCERPHRIRDSLGYERISEVSRIGGRSMADLRNYI